MTFPHWMDKFFSIEEFGVVISSPNSLPGTDNSIMWNTILVGEHFNELWVRDLLIWFYAASKTLIESTISCGLEQEDKRLRRQILHCFNIFAV